MMKRVVVAALVVGLVTPAFADPAVKTERRRSHVVASWTFAGIGATLVAAGVITGRVAHDKYYDAFDNGSCDAERRCDISGFDQTSKARTMGDVGTGIGLAGVGFLATAAIVYLVAPKDSVTVTPAVGENQGAVVLSGRF